MKHPLTEIREAAADLLKTKFRRVYRNRAIAPAQSELPCAVVYLDGRRSERQGISAMFRHDVQLVVLLCVQANADADELAEKMLQETETLFSIHSDLLLKTVDVESLEPESLNIAHDDTGEKVTVYYRQTWRLVYFQEMQAV